MKISHRLYLTSLPAVVAALLMVGLFYWGQYARTAPGIVLVVGVLAVVTSFTLAWSNARYVARRIEGLATRATSAREPSHGAQARARATATRGPSLVPDEIDEIERVVFRLSSAVELAEMNRADREEMFEHRAHDYALLLASVADASTKRIEEVRLPLHILLDNHFGELNENQEEMLGAARSAAEAADSDMLLLRQIAALDLGDRPMRRDRIKPAELVDALRPMLSAAARSAGKGIEFDIAPLLPAMLGDRALLHDAFVTLLRESVASACPAANMRITVELHDASVRFAIHDAGVAQLSVGWAAAVRVVQVHGGTVAQNASLLTVDLPTHRFSPSFNPVGT